MTKTKPCCPRCKITERKIEEINDVLVALARIVNDPKRAANVDYAELFRKLAVLRPLVKRWP